MNCFDFLLALGNAEPSMVEEVISRAYSKADGKPRRRTRKLLRTVLIAAVITTLLAAAAYAVNALFNMNFTNNDKTLTQDFGGSIAHYEDIGLVISFDGPDMCHRVGFKANYLPSEPSGLSYYPDGEWCRSLCDEDTEELGMGGPIPYNISILAASSTGSFIIGGKTEIVKTYAEDEIQVIEILSDYTGTDFERGAEGAGGLYNVELSTGEFKKLDWEWTFGEASSIHRPICCHSWSGDVIVNNQTYYGTLDPETFEFQPILNSIPEELPIVIEFANGPDFKNYPQFSMCCRVGENTFVGTDGLNAPLYVVSPEQAK